MGTDKNYENLANAVIIQAMKDLRKANDALKRRSDSEAWQEKYDELIDFFYSDWLQMLTTVDGEILIDYAPKGIRGNRRK